MPITRRTLIAATASGLVATPALARSRLNWKFYPPTQSGFLRAPVLVWGPDNAILIDGSFTRGDGEAVIADIKALGRNLQAIYVTQPDPDYYFTLGLMRDAFPAARILASPATVAKIERAAAKKLEIWGPQLGPQAPAGSVMPDAFTGTRLDLDGWALEIVKGDPGLPPRDYIRVPSLRAVFGGVLVFNGLHVWTADTPDAAERAAWIRSLDAMAAYRPAVVVPGHMRADAATDAGAIRWTRDYLVTFERELARARDAAALIAAMRARYPDAGLGVALEIGAKVAKGEMAWAR
jgi:glyoxylase-like metal-dependent hydrolase (beta-lactamase superfamily II)